MPNRAQRRKLAREERHISKNAVRLSATEQYRLGFSDGALEAIKAWYAAICLASKDSDQEFLLCNENVIEFLRQVDRRIIMCLESDEIIEEAFNETGLLLDFTKTFSDERVQEKEVS